MGEVRQEKRTHLLVIRFSAMGDVAMLVPVLRVLTKSYPHLKITILTREFFKPIFQDIPNVEVFAADLNGLHNGVRGLCQLAKDLRDLEINAVADVHDVLRSNVLKSIFYLYGIPVKQIEKGRSEKKELTRDSNKVFKPLKTTTQRYADVFGALGYPVDLAHPVFPQKRDLNQNILDVTGKSVRKWLGIAPFAQHSSKVYPLDLMDKVVEYLNNEEALSIFLFGSRGLETEKLEEIALKYTNVKCVAGKLSFEEELSLISNLDAMLSMDSGNAHLAAMFGIPVITLWGVTHPYAGFAAFNQPEENNLLPDLNKYPQIPTSVYGNKVPSGYENVMRSISPHLVAEKVKDILIANDQKA